MGHHQHSDTDSDANDQHAPSSQNRVSKGSRINSDGDVISSGSSATPVSPSELQRRFHSLIHGEERRAYSHVLSAFRYHSDDFSPDQEILINGLRKELMISDDEHSELLDAVDTDETDRDIRGWVKAGHYQRERCSKSLPVHDDPPSPTVSPSPKNQNMTSQPQYPSVGPAGGKHTNAIKVLPSKTPADQAASLDPLIGKKIWIRRPADNHFYEAVITASAKGDHGVVYDGGEPTATVKWIDLKQLKPEDIQWEGIDKGIIPHIEDQSGQDRDDDTPDAKHSLHP